PAAPSRPDVGALGSAASRAGMRGRSCAPVSPRSGTAKRLTLELPRPEITLLRTIRATCSRAGETAQLALLGQHGAVRQRRAVHRVGLGERDLARTDAQVRQLDARRLVGPGVHHERAAPRLVLPAQLERDRDRCGWIELELALPPPAQAARLERRALRQ